MIVPKLRENFKWSYDIPEGIDKTLSEYADLFDEFENRNHDFFKDLDKSIILMNFNLKLS